MDAVGAEGVVLHEALTPSSICTPSRTSVLTGRYASAFVSLHSSLEFQGVQDLRNHSTLPRMLRRAGYWTGFVGKAHVTKILNHVLHKVCGVGEEAEQPEYITRANCDGWDAELLARAAQTLSGHGLQANQSCMAEWARSVLGFDDAAEVYFSNQMMDALHHTPESMVLKATTMIRTAARCRQPFFLYVAPTVPHGPSDFDTQLCEAPRAADGCEPPNGAQRERWASVRRRAQSALLERKLLCAAAGGGGAGGGGEGAGGEGAGGGCPKLCREAQLSDVVSARPWLPEAFWSTGNSLRKNAIGAAWLDGALQPLLALLSDDSVLDAQNTLTVITADHGPSQTGKGSVYQGGMRVPLMMRFPRYEAAARQAIGLPLPQQRTAVAAAEQQGVQQQWPAAARESSVRFSHLDFLPTLAALAGVRGVESHGRDRSAALWPAGPPSAERDKEAEPPLFIEIGYARGVIEGPWKLVLVLLPPREEGGGPPGCFSVYNDNMTGLGPARLKPYTKFVYAVPDLYPHYCDSVQLYHLEEDPQEQRNVHVSNPELVARLSALVYGHIDAVEASQWRAGHDNMRALRSQHRALGASEAPPRRTVHSIREL